MNQEPKMNQVEKMNEKREINNFSVPPPITGLISSQLAVPIWRSEKTSGIFPVNPAHLEWVTGEQSWTLIEIMNSRNNILAQIEELKYAAECLEDLINDWETATLPTGD